MRTYEIIGMTCGGSEKTITRTIMKQLGEGTDVEADASTGEVRVDVSADPKLWSSPFITPATPWRRS